MTITEVRSAIRLPEDVEGEMWRPVADCSERYFISDMGRVASCVRGGQNVKVLSPSLSISGYLTVGVTPKPGDRSETRLVHRMVVEAFVGPAPSPLHIDIRHLDGNKQNNALINLRWGTRSENMKDVYAHRAPAMSERVRERQEASWYREDARLRQIAREFFTEGKLNIADCARLMDCSADVAASIIHADTHRSLEPASAGRKNYRSPARKAAIMALVAEGLGFKDINERLNETLTAQDVYYYRSRLPKS
jgi:hypothetical protein